MSDDRPNWAAEYIRQYCETCPACGSIWSKTVKRCNCGYDFQTQAMGPPSGTGSYNWFWPEITDLESAAAAGRDGAGVAFVVAWITAIFAVLSYFDVLNVLSPWALIDAGVMAILGSTFTACQGRQTYRVGLVYWSQDTGSHNPTAWPVMLRSA